MKEDSIEVSTTQNVTIVYQFASVGERAFSYILDMVFSIIVSSLLTAIISKIFNVNYYMVIYITILFYFFYTLMMEMFVNGQTIAKKNIGLKVIRVDGTEPSAMDYVVRSVFSPLDNILSLGFLSAVFVKITKNNQRIGDIVAGTTVVKIKPKNNFKLNNLLSIGEKYNDYEITYPEVRRFSEEQMIAIKNVLDRVTNNQNEANVKLLFKTIRQVEKTITPIRELKGQKMRIEFLRNVLNDYVISTR